MLVSIIIPAYNAASTLAGTINSALMQKTNGFDLEIIIINDGSTDQTNKILQKYKQDCTIIYQENTGASAARQAGFNTSTGEFIQYLDSDDLLMPDKIAVQLKALIEQEADLAYGDYACFTEKNNLVKIEKNYTGELIGEPEIQLFTDFWRPPCATLYSRKIAQKISWSTTLPVIQDARYLLDAVFMGAKLVYTPGIQARYRINQHGSLSQKSKFNFVKDCFTNAKEVYEIWKLDLNPDRKKALIQVLRNCIADFSISNRSLFKNAIDLLLQIEPNYIPQKSLQLKYSSLIFGYRNAEYLAAGIRKLR